MYEQIDGINLNKAILFDCKWKNIILNEQLLECKGHKQPINQVCLSHDSKLFASASDDGSIILWDLKTGKQKLKKKIEEQIYSLDFSPNKATLVGGNNDGKIYFWNYRQGKIKSLLNGHDFLVTSVCFSPNGAILASGSGDKTIRLWNVSTGELKQQLNGHNSYVTSVCFSPDGATLAFGSQDNTIRLWDVSSRELKTQLNGQSVQDISMSYDVTEQFMLSSNNLQDIFLHFQVQPYVTKVLISQQYTIQANGTLIFQGQISNPLGINLKSMLLCKQSIILDQFLK